MGYKVIDYYKEMLELIIHARLALDRVDEWKKALDNVSTDQTHLSTTTSTNHNIDRIQFYRDYL